MRIPWVESVPCWMSWSFIEFGLWLGLDFVLGLLDIEIHLDTRIDRLEIDCRVMIFLGNLVALGATF